MAHPGDADEELRARFAAIVGRRHALIEPGALAAYQSDGLAALRAVPRIVVLPKTTDEVAAVVRLARAYDMPIVPRGAGTGLSGGALPVPGGIVVGLARMNAILGVDLENQRVRLQPGVTNLAVSRRLAPHGYYYAPDPSSQAVCSIGGNVAENSGGAHCLKYGFTANHVVAATLVRADGEIVSIGSPLADPPGYDLMGVVVGSEGMLGIVTEVVARILRKPQATHTLFATFASTADGGAAVSEIVARGIVPAAIEMMDRLAIEAIVAATGVDWPLDAGAALLIDVDGPAAEARYTAGLAESIVRSCGALLVRAPRDEGERTTMWAGRKSAFAAVGRISPELLRAGRRHPALRRSPRCSRRSRRSPRTRGCGSPTSFTPATATCIRWSCTTGASPARRSAPSRWAPRSCGSACATAGRSPANTGSARIRRRTSASSSATTISPRCTTSVARSIPRARSTPPRCSRRRACAATAPDRTSPTRPNARARRVADDVTRRGRRRTGKRRRCGARAARRRSRRGGRLF